MLGRLTCGDDCLAQIFYNGNPSNKFRYQIQSVNKEEGIIWGKICGKLFNAVPLQFQKPTGEYCSNLMIENWIVNKIIKNGFLELPHVKTNKNTAYALLKNIPIDKILSFNDSKMSEFIAGLFDSDGTIRPLRGEIQISLDSQTLNRKEPLLFKEIRLFIELSRIEKSPLVLRIIVSSPDDKNKRALYLLKEIEKRFPNIPLSFRINRKRKGVSAYINLSTCVRWKRLKENKIPIKFWLENIVPKLIRSDKKSKFNTYYTIRKRFL
jgi:intein/homing endonuclease